MSKKCAFLHFWILLTLHHITIKTSKHPVVSSLWERWISCGSLVASLRLKMEGIIINMGNLGRYGWKATPQGAQAWQANHSHKLSTEESLAPHLKAWKNWSQQNHWYRHLRQEGRKISSKRYTMKYTCIYSYNMNIYLYMNDHAADNWYLQIQKLRKSHTFWRTLILWEVAPADLNVAKSSVKWPCQISQLHEWVPSPTADRRVASDQMTLETSMFSNRTVPNWYLPAAMQYELLNTSIYKCL